MSGLIPQFGALGDERGVTLVELLIAMSLGVVLSIAALGLLDTSGRVLGHVTDQVGSTQVGRVAMDRLDQELEYACVQPPTNGDGIQQFWPIQAALTTPGTPASDNSHLVFYSATGSTSPPTITLHDIIYSATAHTLVDNATVPTGGYTPSTFTYTGATTTATTIASNVALVSGTMPIFQYYAYNSSYELPTIDSLSAGTATALAVPLTSGMSGTASEAAGVWINFAVSSYSGETYATASNYRAAPYNASEFIVLRDSPVLSTATTPYPCS